MLDDWQYISGLPVAATHLRIISNVDAIAYTRGLVAQASAAPDRLRFNVNEVYPQEGSIIFRLQDWVFDENQFIGIRSFRRTPDQPWTAFLNYWTTMSQPSPLTLQAGFAAASSVSGVPNIVLQSPKYARLEGVVARNNPSASLIATIPFGFRPPDDRLFPVWTDTGLKLLRVSAGGAVTLAPTGDAPPNVTLDVATWRVA